MPNEEGQEPTLFERRARAPMHFWGTAQNARTAAEHLWQAIVEKPELREAFRREAALALELIIKSVIAQRIENGKLPILRPSANHDLPKLWSEAHLPRLSPADQGRLINSKHDLIWSGRYPAPKSEKIYKEEALEKHPYRQVVEKFGQRELLQEWSFDWDDFDRIFQVAADRFRAIAPYIDEDGFLIFPEGADAYKG